MSEQRREHRAGEGHHLEPAPESRDEEREIDEEIDEASEASFPASDPPAWMAMRVGGPRPRRPPHPGDRAPMREPDER